MAALLVGPPVLAGCGAEGGAADGGGVAEQPFYVASFALGADTPDARKYVLTSAFEPRIRIVQVTPGPHPSPPVAPSPTPGMPTAPAETLPAATPAPGFTGVPAPAIGWVNNGRYLAVIIYGSGNCPDGPQRIDVVADQKIDVHLGPLFPGRDPCLADLSPHVTVVELPQGVTPIKPLTARFPKHQVTIPAARD
jgi:hypothetical protein